MYTYSWNHSFTTDPSFEVKPVNVLFLLDLFLAKWKICCNIEVTDTLMRGIQHIFIVCSLFY